MKCNGPAFLSAENYEQFDNESYPTGVPFDAHDTPQPASEITEIEPGDIFSLSPGECVTLGG